MKHLSPAIERLREYLQNKEEGHVIDDASGFSAADAREILADLDGRYRAPAAFTSVTMMDEMRHPAAGQAKPDKGFATNGE